MKIYFFRSLVICLTLGIVLSCGDDTTPSTTKKTYTIGGAVTGLAGTLTLTNNDEDLALTTDGNFTFANKVEEDKTYAVTVKTQPADKTCTVTKGSGTATANVTKVVVTCNPKNLIIFVTASSVSGGLDNGGAGIRVYDDFCEDDANYPGEGTYKAFMASQDRRACSTANCSGGVSEHLNWVLQSDRTYVRPDGTEIATSTVNGIFNFPLTNSFTAGTGVLPIWTGLIQDWTTLNTCDNWSDGTSGFTGQAATTSEVDSTSIFFGSPACNYLGVHIACVEQPQ